HSFQRGRFTQVLLPVETVYRQVAQNLFNMGHQKVLLVFRGSEDVFSDQVGSAFEREIAARKSSDFCVDSYYANLDFEHFQTKKDVYQAAEKIIGKLDESYSALVVMSGDYFGFSVWKHLLESRISIPEELSLVVASGRHDLFVELFEITTVFTDAWQEGFACAKEIARQIGSNVIEGGVKYSEYRYIQRKTVAPAGTTAILV
ncbi:MAG: substrate-binding domain-containing protein, partial [Candidatus Pacebacteria bacterium]|nr:substrate-binding domain-containing protein [Candidatus Paceibacterota bacterium]